MRKNSGKTFVIFLALIVVVLISGICISVFMLHQETTARKKAEEKITELKDLETRLSKDLEELKKQLYIVNEKNKEADEKINSLLDDLELEEGLRDQLREENAKLKTTVESMEAEKDKLRDAMAKELESVKAQLTQAVASADQIKAEKVALQDRIDELEKAKNSIVGELEEVKSHAQTLEEIASAQIPVEGEKISETMYERSKLREERMPASPVGIPSPVELDPIVVGNAQGRVLSVDTRTEFLIFDMGHEEGVRPGQVVSIYRGDKFLGDVKVSRVQEKMSAADFIPPFSSSKVRKNDVVVVKPF